MNQQSILNFFNDFFTRTGMREYCSTVCHGACCTHDSCYAKYHNDWEYCHQKLACTSYTCHNIWSVVRKCASYDEQDAYNIMESILRNKIYNHLLIYSDDCDFNIFFSHYCLLNFNPQLKLPTFSEDFYKKIKKIMKKAIKEKRERYNILR